VFVHFLWNFADRKIHKNYDCKKYIYIYISLKISMNRFVAKTEIEITEYNLLPFHEWISKIFVRCKKYLLYRIN
jgi:hypothetical protein